MTESFTAAVEGDHLAAQLIAAKRAIAALRASHAALLAAAKMASSCLYAAAVSPGVTVGMLADCRQELDAAIAAAEEPAP